MRRHDARGEHREWPWLGPGLGPGGALNDVIVNESDLWGRDRHSPAGFSGFSVDRGSFLQDLRIEFEVGSAAELVNWMYLSGVAL